MAAGLEGSTIGPGPSKAEARRGLVLTAVVIVLGATVPLAGHLTSLLRV